MSFGGSLEGGLLTPSNWIALLNTPPRNIKARFFASLRMTEKKECRCEPTLRSSLALSFLLSNGESPKGVCLPLRIKAVSPFKLRDCFSREQQMHSFAMTGKRKGVRNDKKKIKMHLTLQKICFNFKKSYNYPRRAL